MSQLSTVPVYKCPRCGTLVTMTAKTYVPDEKGDLLQKIAKNMGKVAFCRECLNAKQYFDSHGRPEDFGYSASGLIINPHVRVDATYWRRYKDPVYAPDPDRRRTMYFYKGKGTR